ncbi:MAG: histidinol-phosphatase, partial [Candidatus Omnitrophota bacterium]
MKLSRYLLFVSVVALFLLTPFVFCAEETVWSVFSEPKPEIQFPDIPGYLTLVCDFHLHTMFSDGQVWPTVRVDEAWREGLDAISITDHIEYQPHKDDVPTKHNRPFEIVEAMAKQKNILLPRGTEITRDTPPGHFNAIFLDDIDPLDTEDLIEVMRRAHEQGAFIFWNHPGWKGVERGRWGDVQTTMYENKWLNGIEICNGDTYFLEAHHYAVEKNLTVIGTSDMHRPFLHHPLTPDNHRTCTLVFARE